MTEEQQNDVVVRALHSPRIISLCAGIGGLDLGIHQATVGRATTECYVEIEAFCAGILAARMEDGGLDAAPIWSDVKSFDGRPWRGGVDCIIGGYPCQPFSAAGKRKGQHDPRHLWPYIRDIIRTVEPAICFFENVPGHLTLGFEQVCEDLQAMGYGVEAGIFSAAEVGAPHLRKRLFFIAYADSADLRDQLRRGSWRRPDQEQGQTFLIHDGIKRAVANPDGLRQLQPERAIARGRRRSGDGCSDVAYADSIQQQRRDPDAHRPQKRLFLGGQGNDVADSNDQQCQNGPESELHFRGNGIDCGSHDQSSPGPTQCRLGRIAARVPQGLDGNQWSDGWEDGTPRVAIGQPDRIDRLRALGNAVVPAIAELAWRTLSAQVLSRVCPGSGPGGTLAL